MIGIGFGTWAWGNKLIWGYNSARDDSLLAKTFIKATEGGLSIVDTADSYGTGNLQGRSEILIGKFIQQMSKKERNKLIVATKLAPFPWRQGRKSIKKAFLNSQNRLQGNLDRVQLHWSTARYAPWQETQLLDGLGDLFECGSVKEIGLSNIGPDRLMFLHKRLDERRIPIKSIQTQFSLLVTPTKKEKDLQKLSLELGIELLAYSPLALGILAINPDINYAPSTFIRRNLFKQILPKTKLIRKALFDIAKKRGSSQSAVALNWCRAHGRIPLPGIRTPKQALEANQALRWKMTQEEKKYLDELRKLCSISMPNNPFQSS